MYSRYVKESIIIDKNNEEQDVELLENLKMVKNTLDNMHNNLQYAKDELVDYYVYRIKAEEAKYGYLLKQVKAKNLKIN